MPDRKRPGDPFEQIRESARMLDQALGEGGRFLKLIDDIQKTPTHKLVGSMLVGIGRALEKAERPPARARRQR